MGLAAGGDLVAAEVEEGEGGGSGELEAELGGAVVLDLVRREAELLQLGARLEGPRERPRADVADGVVREVERGQRRLGQRVGDAPARARAELAAGDVQRAQRAVWERAGERDAARGP